jgi:glutathione S-transferase
VYILRSSAASPFGRKVKVAAAVLGLIDKIDIRLTDTLDPNDSIRKENPLGKIPALHLEDGTVLFDSRVIVEFLDASAGGGKIIPSSGTERWHVLRLQALVDGLMDAAILQIYEIRFRDEVKREPKWVEHQAGKVTRALDELERSPPDWTGVPDIGSITLACALAYLDFRFEGKWRNDHPKLVAWLHDFEQRVPDFAKSAPN